LQPQGPEEVSLECWYMDDSSEDQRKPHQQDPNVPASPADLKNVGVVSWKLDADCYQQSCRKSIGCYMNLLHCAHACGIRISPTWREMFAFTTPCSHAIKPYSEPWTAKTEASTDTDMLAVRFMGWWAATGGYAFRDKNTW
jgi:hypothetical protein